MSERFDVVGFGGVAIDDLLFVEKFPSPDEKARVLRTERHCGGLTCTALVAASRLGARCAYAGVLGTDELSSDAIDVMAREGIDVSRTVRRKGARPIHSCIVVDPERQTRNIFFNLNGVVGADPQCVSEDLIALSSVLFVDYIGVPGMLRAAQFARKHGIPIVADFEGQDDPLFGELLATVDHLILSREFASRLTREGSPRKIVEKLQGDRVVIITVGAEGCWLSEHGSEPELIPAFSVPAVDTTGCGDVFHGAYAAALALKMPLRERIRLASAAAALKASRPGGQAGIPNRPQLEEFLNRMSSGSPVKI